MRHLTLLLSLLLISPAVAGIVSRDLFEPGDGLLTYDDVNRREWLDFSVSSGWSLEQLREPGDLHPSLAGFKLARLGDIDELGLSVSDSVLQWIQMLEELSPSEHLGLLAHELYSRHFAVDAIAASASISSRVTTIGPPIIGLEHLESNQMHVLANTYYSTCDLRVVIDGETICAGRRLAYADSERVSSRLHDGSLARLYWFYREAIVVPEPTAACLAFIAFLAALRLRVFA